MIESNYADGEYEKLRTRLISGNNKSLHPVEIVTAGNVVASENYLVQSIKQIVQNDPSATVAIISRTNNDIERIVRLCSSQGLEISSERSIDIFNHPMGLLFFALIEFIVDPLATHALSRTIIGGLWNLDFNRVTELLQTIRKNGLDNIDTDIPALLTIRKELSSDSPMSFIMQAATLCGYVELASKDSTYIEVWRGILTFAETVIRQSNISDPIFIMNKLLQYRDRAEQRKVKVSLGAHDASIVAMTAHGSKGLEFDYVFIPYGTEESWKPRAKSTFFVMPIHASLSEEDDIRDARRLFYVALTRAKKSVVICIPETESDGGELTPLRFIQELDKDSVSHTNIPSLDIPHAISESRSSQNDKLLTHIKRVLNDSGLSVTALNNFLECQSTFIFRSIFKIPEPPSLSAEKGNALHKAFARIWADSNKTISHIQEIIENTVREHISDTLLRSHDKEALTAELIKDAPNISASLHTHFNQEGIQYIEGGAEYELKNDLQSIRLHGRLDAVIDTGDRVLVFDYKTTKKKSENEIKGLTQADSFGAKGAYFRQLVFYKILLQNDSRFKGKDIVPSLVFVKPDEKGECHIMTFEITEDDIKKVKDEINSLMEAVYSGSILTGKCNDRTCSSCSLRNLI
jgi:DNA helicase-2/ATP-dependent DNA helicase PcrA